MMITITRTPEDIAMFPHMVVVAQVTWAVCVAFVALIPSRNHD